MADQKRTLGQGGLLGFESILMPALDSDELARIEAAAISSDNPTEQVNNASLQQALLADLRHPNWKHRRFKALQQIEITPETLIQVVAVLDDEQSTLRRWAAALLGASKMAAAVEPQCPCYSCRPIRDCASDCG